MQNDERSNSGRNNASFKGFGVEFDGPPWLAIVLILLLALFIYHQMTPEPHGDDVKKTSHDEDSSVIHKQTPPPPSSTKDICNDPDWKKRPISCN